MIRADAFLALACCAGLSSCVRFGYRREVLERKPDVRLLEQFVVGRAELGEVLVVLGAPLEVFEGADGAPVITYGGLRSGEWGLSVSAPVTDYSSASFSYADGAARTEGFMLIFDVDERLTIVREGNLGDLRQEFVRRRSASVDADDEPDVDPDGDRKAEADAP